MHYLINTSVEKSDMLHNYAPCNGLEAYKSYKYFWLISILFYYRSLIIDDDITVNMLIPDTVGNRLEDDILVEEDKPAIADIIDERPTHIIELENFSDTSKWKKMRKG